MADCLTFNDSKMMENYIRKKCIVRCYGAGIFFGEVKEVSSDANGLNVRLANAVQIIPCANKAVKNIEAKKAWKR